MGGSTISGSRWTLGTDTTRIYYNAGNVGIGTTNPTSRLYINHSSTSANADVGNIVCMYIILLIQQGKIT